MDDLLAEGHRALVFSRFTEMLELLRQAAARVGRRGVALPRRSEPTASGCPSHGQSQLGRPLGVVSRRADSDGKVCPIQASRNLTEIRRVIGQAFNPPANTGNWRLHPRSMEVRSDGRGREGRGTPL